jgi:hypothetical protein
MPDESQANTIRAGPFTVLRDSVDNVGMEFLTRENLQDLGLGEMRVFEDDGKKLRMAFRQKGACHASGATSSKRYFLTQRKLRKPTDELIFGDAFQFGGRAGQERELAKVHWIEVADQAEAHQTLGTGMEGEGMLDAIILEEVLAASDLFEDFGWDIFPGQEETQIQLIEGRIVEKGQEDIRGVMVEKGA